MDKKKVLRVILNTLAPPSDITEGLISKALEGKSVKEAVEWLATNNIWETIPDKHKKMFITYCPEDMSWFNYNWMVKAISKSNVALASKILGSPSLQKIIEKQIESIKAQLKREV